MNMEKTNSIDSNQLSTIELDSKTEFISTKQKLKKKLLNWCLSTTSHGIPRIIGANSFYKRFIWLIFSLISFSLCSFMVSRAISEFSTFGVTTTIRVLPQNKITFPIVSICNANIFVTKEANNYLVNSKDLAWKKYITNSPNFDVNLKKSFGYNLTSMIYNCGFRFNRCEFSNFEWYFDPNYGNCFKFSSGRDMDNEEIPYESVAREGDGIQLDIFLGIPDTSYTYFHETIHTGIVVTISDQERFPIRNEGIIVRPGSYTKVKLNRIETSQLPSPYSNCIEWHLIDTQLSNELKKLGIRYTRRNCLSLCEQKKIVENFGCYSLQFPPIFDMPPCENKTVFQQISNFVFSFDQSCFDMCPYECDSVDYDLSTSSSDFPSFRYYRVINNSFPVIRNTFNDYNITNVTYDLLKNSVLSIFIYYDEIKATILTEAESISMVDLISNIGGTMGLFVGVSVLSFMEIIELFSDLLMVTFKALFEKEFKTWKKMSKIFKKEQNKPQSET